MKDLIEHGGKKYRVVEDDPINDCEKCDLKFEHDLCEYHERFGFPDCFDLNCHFELVTETNQKE